MSLQGPLVIVAENPTADITASLAAAGAFPLIEARPADAPAAIAAVRPAAILLADPVVACDVDLATYLAKEVTSLAPIVPVLARAGRGTEIPYREALPIAVEAPANVIAARLSVALRVRNLHATVLRRADMARAAGQSLPSAPQNDPIEDATVIVAGRGRSYPTLAVAVGERAGLIGALSIETAARYLRTRDLDGLLIGDGFSTRIVDAVLTVIGEDPKFRDLPIALLLRPGTNIVHELPNLTTATDPGSLLAHFLPFVRLHAFEARLKRITVSLDAGGMIDADTGLFFPDMFVRDLDRAILDAADRGTNLSIARFTFTANLDRRTARDAARLVSRLVREVDFGCQEDDGSILLAFTETNLNEAHFIARRIASVLKHTMLNPDRDRQTIAPSVTLATRKSTDNIATLLACVATPAVAAE